MPYELLAGLLDAAVRAAGVPLVSVQIGDPTDRRTWRARLAPGATATQQQTADAEIAAFDLSTYAARVAAQESDTLATQKLVMALVAYLYRVTHGGTNPTPQQLLSELGVVKTIYRALP